MFDIDRAVLKQQYQSELSDLATILNKYDDTNILLEGHTDSTGSEDHNLKLSERRAQSVADYIKTQNVNPARLAITGYGEAQPIADNETAEGRAKNRRVEVAIYANEKLKKKDDQVPIEDFTSLHRRAIQERQEESKKSCE